MKKINPSFFAFMAILPAMTFNSCAQKSGSDSTKVLAVDAFAKKIESTANAQLVDVRTPEEFKEGHLKGFTNIDWQGANFQAEISKLDKNKPTFIHCRSGKRSAAANEAMLKLGFKEVYDLKGGINAWKEAGKPVE